MKLNLDIDPGPGPDPTQAKFSDSGPGPGPGLDGPAALYIPELRGTVSRLFCFLLCANVSQALIRFFSVL